MLALALVTPPPLLQPTLDILLRGIRVNTRVKGTQSPQMGPTLLTPPIRPGPPELTLHNRAIRDTRWPRSLSMGGRMPHREQCTGRLRKTQVGNLTVTSPQYCEFADDN